MFFSTALLSSPGIARCPMFLFCFPMSVSFMRVGSSVMGTGMEWDWDVERGESPRWPVCVNDTEVISSKSVMPVMSP